MVSRTFLLVLVVFLFEVELGWKGCCEEEGAGSMGITKGRW